MKIALLVPCTSNKKQYTCFKDTDLYKYLFKSFFLTYNTEHEYVIYLGFDDDDIFYNSDRTRKDILRYVQVMKSCTVKFRTFNHIFKGNPCGIWNGLFSVAIQDKNDYFVQVGDDIMFLDKEWVNCALTKLKHSGDIGVVGLLDQGRKEYNPRDSLFTQTIVSKKHYDIFGFYFPPEITSWGCDNFIGDIYDKHKLKLPIYQRIYNCGGEPRYEVPLDFKEQYFISMNKYKDKIDLYFKLKLDQQFIYD